MNGVAMKYEKSAFPEMPWEYLKDYDFGDKTIWSVNLTKEVISIVEAWRWVDTTVYREGEDRWEARFWRGSQTRRKKYYWVWQDKMTTDKLVRDLSDVEQREKTRGTILSWEGWALEHPEEPNAPLLLEMVKATSAWITVYDEVELLASEKKGAEAIEKGTG